MENSSTNALMENFEPFRDWLFRELPEPRTRKQISQWWRSRRLAYNAIVLGVGFVSFIVFLILSSTPGLLKEGEDAAEPMAVLFAWIPINICYTAGSIIKQWSLRRRRFQSVLRGPILMAVGIAFSLFVVLLPSVMVAIVVVIHLIFSIRTGG